MVILLVFGETILLRPFTLLNNLQKAVVLLMLVQRTSWSAARWNKLSPVSVVFKYHLQKARFKFSRGYSLRPISIFPLNFIVASSCSVIEARPNCLRKDLKANSLFYLILFPRSANVPNRMFFTMKGFLRAFLVAYCSLLGSIKALKPRAYLPLIFCWRSLVSSDTLSSSATWSSKIWFLSVSRNSYCSLFSFSTFSSMTSASSLASYSSFATDLTWVVYSSLRFSVGMGRSFMQLKSALQDLVFSSLRIWKLRSLECPLRQLICFSQCSKDWKIDSLQTRPDSLGAFLTVELNIIISYM